jgi:hypothetical protein
MAVEWVMMIAEIFVGLAGLYVLAGVLFAVPFAAKGVMVVDPVAVGSPWGFRLLITPGVIALWPLMAMRWRSGGGPPDERNAHRDAAVQP